MCYTACTEEAIRLVAGPDAYEGRVEVCYNNQLGTVCDRGFGTSDARAACRQAGYSGESFGNFFSDLKHVRV